MPMTVAMSAWVMPKPIIALTVLRCSAVGWCFGFDIECFYRREVTCFREGAAGLLQHRLLAGEQFPAPHRHVAILWADLDGVCAAPGHLSGDDGGAGAAERFIHRLAGRGVVLDRAAHALDWLLCAVAGFGLVRLVNLPQRR